MSTGNRVLGTRVSPEELAEIDEAIQERNARTAKEPWGRSEWLRAAVREKLRHLKRGRSQQRRRPSAVPASAASAPGSDGREGGAL